MSLYNSELWNSDLNKAINTFPFFDEFAGKSFLITGAGGLICSAVTDIFIFYNETHKSNISIFAAGRSLKRMQERFGVYSTRDYFHFVQYDATDSNPLYLPSRIDYIIHGASTSVPEKFIKEPVETMTSNIFGILSLFQLAQKKQVQRLLYISSSEVYGNNNDINNSFSEDSYGFIDHLNPRSSYPIAKKAAEAMCIACTNEYSIESTIVRPGYIYGPTSSLRDPRVPALWSYAAAQGNDIIMKSDGSQIRSCCYSLDCATAILTVLLRGNSKEAYNISDHDSIITLRQLGEIIAKAGGVRFMREEASLQEKKAFNPMHNLSLSSKKLEMLGWKSFFNIYKGIEHTLKILKDTI